SGTRACIRSSFSGRETSPRCGHRPGLALAAARSRAARGWLPEVEPQLLDVALRALAKAFSLLARERADHLRRDARDEHPVRHLEALAHDGARGDERFLAGHGAAEEHRTHADQRAGPDAHAVQDAAVPDRDLVADHVGRAWIGVDH